MAIFSVIFVILALILPICIIAFIVYFVGKKNKNNEEKKDNFEKNIRTIYTYILVLAFLISSIVSFISAVETITDYLLPEENINKYSSEDLDYREKLLDEKNNKNEMIVSMVTNIATFAICMPMFVYHINLTKKDK